MYKKNYNKNSNINMQSVIRSFYHQSVLMNSSAIHLRRFIPLMAAQSTLLRQAPRRSFAAQAAEVQVKKPEKSAELDIEVRNKKIGVDMKFNEQKHAYVLTFPWNF